MMHRVTSKPPLSQTSAEIVTNIEDLLTQILVRVPARPLLRFNCVSKHWHSLISNPEFRHKHTRQNPNPSVSAVLRDSSIICCSVSFPPHSSLDNWEPLNVIADKHGPIQIISSCNGLLLCCPYGERATENWDTSTCFVLNPTTNQFTKLGIPRACATKFSRIAGCDLAFDPSKSSHYKVMCVEDVHFPIRYWKIRMYSSETRTWRLVDSVFVPRISYRNGVYWNGAIHWLGSAGAISYYHIEQEYFKFVSTAPGFRSKYKSHFHAFKESSSGRLQLTLFHEMELANFDVLEMGEDYSGWFVKYKVGLDIPLQHFQFGYVILLFIKDKGEEDDDVPSFFVYVEGQVMSYNLTDNKRIGGFDLARKWPFARYREIYLHKETLASV